MKQSFKTESVAEFLARGGQIKRCDAKVERKRQPRPKLQDDSEVEESTADYSALPMALKIRYGIKG